MAFIRVSRCQAGDEQQKDDVIINTRNILYISADEEKPSRGAWIQMAGGDSILTGLSFEEIWTLVQRET